MAHDQLPRMMQQVVLSMGTGTALVLPAKPRQHGRFRDQVVQMHISVAGNNPISLSALILRHLDPSL